MPPRYRKGGHRQSFRP